MTTNRSKIYILRAIHTLFALFFIFCIGCIYYSAITLSLTKLFYFATISIFVEGFLVFVLNGGHCPLAPLQRKLNDPIPFFNLFLPDYLAKRTIPFFTVLTFLGWILLVFRLLFKF